MHKGRIKRFMAGAMSAIMVVSGLGTTPLAYGGEFAEETVAVEASEDTPEVAAAEEDVAPAQAEEDDFARAGEAAAEEASAPEDEADFEEVTEEAEEAVYEAEESVEAAEIVEKDVDGDDIFDIRDGMLYGLQASVDKSSITSISIPADVTAITKQAFESMPNLTTVNFDEATNLDTINVYAFYNCANLTTLDFSKCVKLRTIDAYAFAGCKALTSVQFYEDNTKDDKVGLDKIGDYAFSDDEKLEELILPNNLTSLGIYAFKGCKELATVKVNTSADVAIDGTKAFYGCAIENISFGDDVTRVSNYIFNGAGYGFDEVEEDDGTGNKKKVKKAKAKVLIHSGITEIGEYAFGDPENKYLLSVTVATPSAAEKTAGKGLQKINKYAFSGNTNLATVVLPMDSITEIGASAFSGCENMNQLSFTDNEELGIVSDKNSVRLHTIGDSAFSNCLQFNKVVIPSTVTSLGEHAFDGCSSLSTAIVKDNITTLPKYVFYNCALTETFNFNKVTIVGDYALSGNKFVNLVIPDTIIECREGAFRRCRQLKTLKIGSGLTSLEKLIFDCCWSLGEVIIPEKITAVGYGAFADCYSLKKVTFLGETKTIGDYAFGPIDKEKDLTGNDLVISCPNLEEVVFHEGLTDIGVCAFKCDQKLSTFTLPKTLKTIGAEAFEECESIATLTIPENVTKIGDKAFNYAKTKKLHIGSKLIGSENPTDCGQQIFMDCLLDDVTFVEGIEEIPDNLFYQATYSTTGGVVIPATVKTVGKNSFAGVVGQKNGAYFRFANGSKVETIGEGAFANRPNLTEMVLPETLVTIGKNAFLNDLGFTDFKIPASVAIIGEGAFSGCTGLLTLSFAKESDLLSIEKDAFKGCAMISKIDIPTGVRRLGDGAFADCNALTHLYIPSSVDIFDGEKSSIFKGVQDVAFRTGKDTAAYDFLGGSGISGITEGVKYIDYKIDPDEMENDYRNSTCYETDDTHEVMKFQPCMQGGAIFEGWYIDEAFTTKVENTQDTEFKAATKNTDIISLYPKFRAVSATWDMFIDEDKDKVIEGIDENYKNDETKWDGTWIIIPADCKGIEPGAFKGNVKLSSLVFDEGCAIEKIGDEAFAGCLKLRKLDFTKCSKLTTIGKSAFKGCVNVSKIKFNPELSTIRGEAFMGCLGVEEITLEKGLSLLGGQAFAGCMNLSKVRVNSEKLVVSNSTEITGSEIKVEMKGGAFNGCKLDTIEFGSPDDGTYVSTIPSGLFAFATFKEDGMDLVVDEHITDIGIFAFCYAQNLKSVDLSKLKEGYSIKEAAFKEVPDLKTVKLGDKAVFIGKEAFYKDAILDNVTMPESLTDIGESAFEGCAAFTQVMVPKNVKSMGNAAFKNCTELKLSDIESTILTGIPEECYSGDEKLTKVTFKENITTIGDKAFYGCSNLESVSFNDNITSIGASAFENCAMLTTPAQMSKALTEIKDAAFKGCVSVEAFELSPVLVSIGKEAFSGCSKFKGITMPATLESIGESAFKDCTSLEKVDAKEGCVLKTIGTGAFEGCSDITFVVIPEKVTSVGNSAFKDNKKLGSIMMNAEALEAMGSMSNPAFEGCIKLSEKEDEGIQFGNSVTIIPAFLLYKANIKDGFYASIKIPASVKKIGEKAFSGVVMEKTSDNTPINIKEVTFEAGIALTEIGKDAFRCTHIQKGVLLPDSSVEIGTFVMPLTVEKLGEFALADNPNLKKVILSPLLVSLPNGLFANDSALENAEYTGEVLREIGVGAFLNCSRLKSFDIPSTVTTIQSHAFAWCDSLIRIYIPESVSGIVSDAFEGNTKLEIVAVEGSKGYEFAKENQIKVTTDGIFTIDYVLGAEGATNPNAIQKYYGDGAPVYFPTPECEGKEFVGWYTDEAKENKIESTEGKKENLTLYAGWKTDYAGFTYTILFNKNLKAANKTPDSITVKGDEKFKLPVESDLDVKGYTLTGWCTVADPEASTLTDEQKAAIKTYKPGEELEKLFDKKGQTLTLYAQWKGQTFKINYVLPDKAVNSADNKDTYDVSEKAQDLADANLGIKGAAFAGWAGVIGDKFLSKIKQIPADTSGDLTLYAVFDYSKNNYTVKLDANEGKFESGVPTSISAHKTNGFMLPMKGAVTREGYTFKGWGKKAKGTPLIKFEGENKESAFIYYKKNLSTKSDDEESSSSSDVTLYAIWSAFEYNENTDMYGFTTVSSDGLWYFPETDDPTVGGGFYDAKQYAKRKTTHSAAKKLKLQKPKKQGYTFKEWSVRDANDLTKILATDKSGVPKDIAGDIVVVPTWTENQYSIIYNGNGGTVNGGKTYKDTEMRLYSVSVNLLGSKDVTSLDGRTFVGWAMDKKATAPVFLDGVTYDKITKYDPKGKLSFKKKGKVKLFAIWK